MFARALSARSSLVARSLLTAPRASIAAIPSKFQREQFARNFNSSSVLKNAAVASKEEDAPGPGALIEKYGSLSFWGMLASIVITKEVFIIDAEFLLACEIGAFAMTCYVLTGDTVDKASRDMDQQKTDKFNAANDFMLELFNQYKLVQGVAGDKPAVLESYLKEYKEAIVAHAAYQTVLPRHKARAAALASLEQIKAKEEHAASMEWQATVDKACANVNAAFAKGDKKLNDQMLQLAISNMGFSAPTTDEKNDPVKALFMKEFA